MHSTMTDSNRVIVAPTGNYGSITEVITRKAGSHRVSDNDSRTLVEFRKQIYDIDISPDEIPLLKVKMVNSEATFTYPPSMCFFAGGDSLVIPAGALKFIESKKSTLKKRMDEVTDKAIPDLKIGDLSLGSDAAITEAKTDVQAQLLQEAEVLFLILIIWQYPNDLLLGRTRLEDVANRLFLDTYARKNNLIRGLFVKSRIRIPKQYPSPCVYMFM